jgi:hypothetical protein
VTSSESSAVDCRRLAVHVLSPPSWLRKHPVTNGLSATLAGGSGRQPPKRLAAGIIDRKRHKKIPSQPTSDVGSPRGEQPSRSVLGLSGLLIELLLPVVLSAALLLALASYTSYWNLHSALGLGLFGLLLATLSAVVSLRLDSFTAPRRRRSGTRRWLNRPGPRWRLVKFILGGLVIPLAALGAANLFELPNHQTPMAVAALAVRSQLAKPETSRAKQIGDAVLRARSPFAKVQGILALQAMSSAEAPDQLLRILSEDPTALKNDTEYQALSAALASYAVQTKGKLLLLFSGAPPRDRRSAPAPPGDPFERESAGQSPTSTADATEARRLPTAQAESKPASDAIASDTQPVAGPASLPSFIMQTFLRMSLTEDADLLAFAHQTAADEQWSEAVRGQALQLTAKLGGKDDLDGLYAYLEGPNALLQAHALRAIAALQSKLSAAATKG